MLKIWGHLKIADKGEARGRFSEASKVLRLDKWKNSIVPERERCEFHSGELM